MAQNDQRVKIILADIENAEPISFAYIQNNTNISQTISNIDGEGNVYYSSKKESISISHIAYKSLEITIYEALENDTIYLQKNEHLLNTVYITDSSPEQILLKALENTSQKLFVPGKIEAYYKEFVKRNGEYVSFTDADFTYFIKRGNKGVKVVARLKGSRVYNIPVEKDKFDIDLISPIGYEKTLGFYDPESIGKFLNPENMKYYIYDLNMVDNYYIIEIKPQKNVNKPLYEGKVKIRISDNSLQSIDYQLAESKLRFAKEVNALIIKVRLIAHRTIIEFSEFEEHYYPIYIRTTYKLKSYNNKNIDQENTFINDVYLYAISEDQAPISKKDIFKKASVYKNGTQFSKPYWEGKNSLIFTEEENIIINSIPKK